MVNVSHRGELVLIEKDGVTIELLTVEEAVELSKLILDVAGQVDG